MTHHISWDFLDPSRAAIEAVRVYRSMRFIMESTSFAEDQVRATMSGVGSPTLSGLPQGHDPRGREKRLAAGIDQLDILAERHSRAEEYMAWFEPAWTQLTDGERYVLEAFYMGERAPMAEMTERLGVEEKSVYTRKDRALKRLSLLLYGR